jgi:hypothetical protein
MKLRPISIKEAKPLVARWHRHNIAPQSGMFAVAVERDGVICGVGIAGRPVARMLQDGYTAEIIRIATDGADNACSMLYGALRRAAKALGYRRLYTYTLESEPGSSLRASGFVVDMVLPPRSTWDTPSRARVQEDMFGNQRRPAESKIRWVWPANCRDGAGGVTSTNRSHSCG